MDEYLGFSIHLTEHGFSVFGEDFETLADAYDAIDEKVDAGEFQV